MDTSGKAGGACHDSNPWIMQMDTKGKAGCACYDGNPWIIQINNNGEAGIACHGGKVSIMLMNTSSEVSHEVEEEGLPNQTVRGSFRSKSSSIRRL